MCLSVCLSYRWVCYLLLHSDLSILLSIHTSVPFLSIYCSARQCLRAYGKKITFFSLHSQWVIRGSRPAGGGNLFIRKRGCFIVHSFSSSPTHRFDMTEILYKMTENRKSSIQPFSKGRIWSSRGATSSIREGPSLEGIRRPGKQIGSCSALWKWRTSAGVPIHPNSAHNLLNNIGVGRFRILGVGGGGGQGLEYWGGPRGGQIPSRHMTS